MYSTSEHESDVDQALSHRIFVDYMVKPITLQDAARIVHGPQSLDTAS